MDVGADVGIEALSLDARRLRMLIGAHRDEIVARADALGIRNVRLCGSVARGDAGPQSDIDLVVDVDEGRSLFDLGELMLELVMLLGVDVDVIDAEGARRSWSPSARRMAEEALAI